MVGDGTRETGKGKSTRNPPEEPELDRMGAFKGFLAGEWLELSFGKHL